MPVDVTFLYEFGDFLQENTLLVLGLAVIITAAVLLWYKIDKRTIETYEETGLEERINEKLKNKIQTIGTKSDKALYRGDFQKIGKVHRYKDMKMVDNEKLMPKEESKDNHEYKGVRVLLVSPEQFFDRMIWYATDVILNFDFKTKVMVLYKDSIEATTEYMRIDENAQFKIKGGAIVQKGYATDNTINEIALADADESIFEGIPNYVEKVNYYDRIYSQRKSLKEQDMEGENF